MPDIFSKEKRSKIMSGIRSKGSRIEAEMMKALEKSNIRSEYQPKILGRPDFLIYPNIVVFCDSSFWHGRNWKKLKPQLKEGYWQEHIEKNRERDKMVNAGLRKAGYVVLRFWDTQIEKDVDSCIEKIKNAISGSQAA